MSATLRLSRQTAAILAALLQTPSDWRYGYDLSRETALKSGTLYPILGRLADQKWLEMRWEHAEENGKPRHLYRLTAEGKRRARASLHENAIGLRALKLAFREK
jgi:DNA-binding PadR family transcriptional regulator